MKKALAVVATIALVSNFGMLSYAESIQGHYLVKEKRPINMTKEEKILKAKKEAKEESMKKAEEEAKKNAEEQITETGKSN